jgi:F0F1-type ATP synthase assembly protein I
MKESKATGPAPGGETPGGETPGGEPADPNQWLAFLNLGWMIVANMALFVGLGLWLDHKFRTAPWLLLTGVFLAFAASGYTIFLAVKRLETGERKKPRQGKTAAS